MSEPWALILGVSSGFGAATARAFSAAGHHICGVHLDRRSGQPRVDALARDITQAGRRALLLNRNAADDAQRGEVIAALREAIAESDGRLVMVMHSLAFGSLQPLVPAKGERQAVTRRQLEMTMDVMANSLVYWVQDLLAAELLGRGARIYAMTSTGSRMVWNRYGPVSAAKAALESHVRQLCLELAPRGVTINAIMAGVTRTPALAKIPDADQIETRALGRNPHDRLTRPEDVADCLLELSRSGTRWMTGNVIRVDGGEDFCA